MISRRPSVVTAAAIIAATETMRPLRYAASSHRYGHSPVHRPLEESLDPFLNILMEL
jgi:hypothetical protein